jgi:uncharacterized LabA/DUF88 family protein
VRLIMNRSEKLALFIDGPNLHLSARRLGFTVDFKRLIEEFAKRGSLLRAYYYTAFGDNDEFTIVRPLIDWLDFNGFTVKHLKEWDAYERNSKVKRNIGVELSVDALEIVRYVDHVILFTGDGDYLRLVQAIQHRGKRVTAVSSIRTKPATMASELRRQVDAFIELDELKGSIGQTLPRTVRGAHLGASAAGIAVNSQQAVQRKAAD